MKKFIYRFLIYFITSSFLMWISFKTIFYNESLLNFRYLYWFLPTIIAFLICILLFKFYKKNKGFMTNLMVVYSLCLTTSNLFSTLFILCDPKKNSPFFITILLFLINSLLTYLVIKNLKKLTVDLNKWIILLVTCISLFGNYFYVYSINILYDNIFYFIK